MSATEELLGELHDAVATQLLEKVRAGTASPAELSAAIKFLKDNGIEALATANTKLDNLAREFPEFATEEPLHGRH